MKAVAASPPTLLLVSKSAVIEVLPFNIRVQFAAPVQPPFQDANASLFAGVSLKVTCVLGGKLAEQVLGQLIPGGLLVTVPVPVPASTTVSCTPGSNAALTLSCAVMDTLQDPVPAHPPLQPSKK